MMYTSIHNHTVIPVPGINENDSLYIQALNHFEEIKDEADFLIYKNKFYIIIIAVTE